MSYRTFRTTWVFRLVDGKLVDGRKGREYDAVEAPGEAIRRLPDYPLFRWYRRSLG